jgi:hypothetical protein
MALPTIKNKKNDKPDSAGIGRSILSGISKVFTTSASRNHQTLVEIKDLLQKQYDEQIKFRKQQEAAAEEARREALNKLKPEKEKKTAKKESGESGGIGGLGILGIGAIAGVIASITGLDDVIRTIQLPQTIKRLTTGFKGIGGAIGNIAVIVTKYTTDITKIATDFTKNLGRMIFDSKAFTAFAEKMKNIFRVIQNASESLKVIAINNLPNLLKPFTEFFKAIGNIFKTVAVSNFENAKSAFPAVTNFFKSMFSFFDTAKTAVSGFALEVFEKAKTGFTAVSGFLKSTLSFFNDMRIYTGVLSLEAADKAKSAVSGFVKFLQPVIGFFKSAFKVVEPFVAPILNIAKIGGRALFGPILAVIDFVTGFVKGFSESEGGTIEGIMAGIREGIFEIFRGFVTFPLDLIKNGLSWVFKKMGFEGGVDALDSFSFTDVFNKLVKGDFDIIGKIGKFISGIYEGIMDLIPSVEDVVLGAISLIPSEIARNFALSKAQDMGLVGETGAKKLEASEKQSELQDTDAKIEKLESKDNLRKGEKTALARLKKERDEQQKELDTLRDQVKEAELVNDKRSDEEIEKDMRKSLKKSAALDKVMDKRFEAFKSGNYRAMKDGKELSGKELEDAFHRNQQKDHEERVAADQKISKGRDVLMARDARSREQEREKQYSQAEEEVITALADGQPRAFGVDRYKRLTQKQKDALIKSKTGDAEAALRGTVLGGVQTGVAIDAGSRAAQEAANQNQQVNVVSAPQTDASTTVNNQTTNVAPGAAMARNPDSSYRMGTFRAL